MTLHNTTQIQLKGAEPWFWIHSYKGDDKTGNTVLERFNLDFNGTGEIMVFTIEDYEHLFDMEIFNNSISIKFLEPLEALRYYIFEKNLMIEYRRDPHKLNLGIEEFYIFKKDTIFDKL